MKRNKFVIGGIVLAFGVTLLMFNINVSYNQYWLPTLNLYNVEALADEEDSGHMCTGSGDIFCGKDLEPYKTKIYL